MADSSFRVGELEIVRILELEFPLARTVLPIGDDPEALAARCRWAVPHFVHPDGDIVFALTVHAVVSGGKKILIDPCCSFDLRRDNADMPERAAGVLDRQLPAAGFAPSEVDLVLNTHVDGVGWNVRPDADAPAGWVPSFPNARCLWPQPELDRVNFVADGESTTAGDKQSLAPLVAAGQVEGVSTSHRVTEEIAFRPSPGHMRGNVDIWLESRGECAVLVGDHVVNALQCAEPDWAGLDACPEDSGRVRRALLDECVERDALLIGPHFGTPGAGRVRRDGDAYRLEAV